VAGRQGEAEQEQADTGHRKAAPLARADAEAEQAVGHDGEQDEPAGENRLDYREGRKRDGRDVQQPCEQANAHADREPALAPQRGSRAQRMADVDGAGRAGTTMLVEERQVRREGADQRNENSKVKGHRNG
jgi:hypothetical protein